MSQQILQITKADAGIPLSRDEFADAQFAEPWKYARIKGRLVVMNPAGHDHSWTGGPIRNYLGMYCVQHSETVEQVVSEAWIAVGDHTDRIADIAVYLTSSAGRIPDRLPDIVFEIVSEANRDRHRDYEEKRADYESIGVSEYVIVDRFDHRVTVLRLSESHYDETLLGPEDCYTTPMLPGLEIPLADVI